MAIFCYVNTVVRHREKFLSRGNFSIGSVTAEMVYFCPLYGIFPVKLALLMLIFCSFYSYFAHSAPHFALIALHGMSRSSWQFFVTYIRLSDTGGNFWAGEIFPSGQ